MFKNISNSFLMSISRPIMNRRSTSPMWEIVSISCSFSMNPNPIFGPIIIPADKYARSNGCFNIWAKKAITVAASIAIPMLERSELEPAPSPDAKTSEANSIRINKPEVKIWIILLFFIKRCNQCKIILYEVRIFLLLRYKFYIAQNTKIIFLNIHEYRFDDVF